MNLYRIVARVVIIGLLALAIAVTSRPWPYHPATTPLAVVPESLSLRPPSFLEVAHAQAQPQSGANFLQQEAGIAAYVNVGREINLASARSAFKIIEAESEAYLIGSVTPPSYDEWWDVHVYVHKDGWIVAYYLRSEPAAKMIDWADYSGGAVIGTHLENVLQRVRAATGTPGAAEIGYYDFRYPQATHLMIIGEYVSGERQTDPFTYQIPEELIVTEGSWLLFSRGRGSSFSVDGEEVGRTGGWNYAVLPLPVLRWAVDHHAVLSTDWNTDAAGVFLVLSYYEMS